jgi:hypothetical protein
MMTKVLLCFNRSEERQGVVPVNTYEYSHFFSTLYPSTVVYHLERILSNFLDEELESYVFWLENIEAYEMDRDEGYGDIYDSMLADEEIVLPEDAYKAAIIIAKNVLSSQIWVDDFVNNDKYKLTGYTVEEIPEEAPSTGPVAPVDPRYTIGDKLINSSHQRATYAGVLYDPIDVRFNSRSKQNYDGKALIGIHNNDFVKEEVVKEFIKNNVMHFYPLPMVAMRHVRKGCKWFAQSPNHPNIEGTGRTPEDAVERLAVKIIFSA